MRPHEWVIIAVLSVLLAEARPAAAQELQTPVASAPDEDPHNAATWYRKAFEKYQRANRGITEAQWMAVYDFEGDPSRGAPPDVRQTLRRLQPAITLTLRAARQPRMHFESAPVENGDGRAASNAMLSSMRSLLRLVGYDMLVRMHDEDRRTAVEQLAALYRMSDHASDDASMMGSLVGSALLAFADRRATEATDRALIGLPEAAVLLQSLPAGDSNDPMRYRDALVNEAQRMSDLLEERYAGGDGLQRFREDYAFLPQEAPAAAPIIQNLTPGTFEEMLRECVEATDRIAEAISNPNAEAGLSAMRAVQAEVATGPYGALAEYVAPLDGEMLQKNMLAVRTQLDERRRTLTGLADGTIDPMSLANAAVWWIRATLQVDDIDPEKRRLIDVYAARHDAPPESGLVAIFDRHDVQTLLRTLRDAAGINRCDWTYARGHFPQSFRPYHAGLLWCSRLLIADAARHIHAQQYDQAVKNLACAYSLSADVATDQTIAGALSAHRIFQDADALAAAALDAGMFTGEHVAVMAQAVAQFSRGEPFHYQPAIARMRRNLEGSLGWLVQGTDGDEPRLTPAAVETAAAVLAPLDHERLLALQIIDEYRVGAMLWRTVNPGLINSGLEPIFDLTAFADAADFAPALTEWARQKNLAEIQNAALPVIAPLAERARNSIDDYRRCVRRFDAVLPTERSVARRATTRVVPDGDD